MRRAILVLVLLGGCQVKPPVAGSYSLPKDTATTCATHCKTLGMELSAVVIISDSAGCVCVPPGAPPGAPGGPAAAAAAMAIEQQSAQSTPPPSAPAH